MTLRVDIPKKHFERLKFPNTCPVCMKRNPDASMELKTYFGAIQPLNEPLNKAWKVNVPVCDQHRKNIILGRWISRVVFFILIILTVGLMMLIWNQFKNINEILLIGSGIGLIGLSIYFHSKIYTAPLLIEAFSYRLLFTFKNDDLAKEFAELNGVDKVFTVMNQERKLSD